MFDWSKDLEKIIDYKIDDNFLTTMKTNSDKHDSLAITIIGQLRSFPELFEKFNTFIESLKKVFPKVVIFFYISTDVSYHWRYKQDNDALNYLKTKYKFSLEDFKNLVKGLKCEYYIKEKINNFSHISCISQLYDIHLCHLDIYKYEEANNIKFNYILKTRPDCYLKDETFDFKHIFVNDIFFFNWDAVYTYPRDFSIILDQFITYLREYRLPQIIYKEIISNYFKNIPDELQLSDIMILLEHFVFLISTQYLKIIKYNKIQVFIIDKAIIPK